MAPKTDAPTVSMASHIDYRMEAVLFKLADRGSQWNSRYFVLSGNRLTYFHKKGDSTPKGNFLISSNRPGECRIGNLFIDQCPKGNKKQLLYCFKMTWNLESSAADNESLLDESPEGFDETNQLPLPPGAVQTPGNVYRSSKSHHSPLSPEDALSLDDVRATRSKPKFRNNLWSKSTTTPRSKALPGDDEAASPLRSSSFPPVVHDAALSIPSFETDDHGPRGLTLAPREFPEDDNDTKMPLPRKINVADDHLEEKQLLLSLYQANKKESQKKVRKRVVGGSKLAAATGAAVTVGVLTAGVGILAGLAFLGASAAAGGTSFAAGAGYQRTRRKRGEITLASASYEEARAWKSALDACLVSETVKDSTWGQLFAMEGRSATTALLPTEVSAGRNQGVGLSPREDSFIFYDDKKIDPASSWLPIEGGWTSLLGIGAQGLRIFRAERDPTRYAKLAVEGQPCVPLKTQMVMTASPLHAFMCLMSLSRTPLDSSPPFVPGCGQRSSFRVLKHIDNNMDVIHVFFRPLYLFPSWTTPRDFVLFRYWRHESDGTYVICYNSVAHRDCPPLSGYTRGEMHAVYTIAPRKKVRGVGGMQTANVQSECLMTSVVQVDPKGWVPLHVLSFYGEAFSISALMQLLDIRDALDQDRFVSVALDSQTPRKPVFSREFTDIPTGSTRPVFHRSVSQEEDGSSYDFNFAHRESRGKVEGSARGISKYPPCLSPQKFAEPDANSFVVRGKTYKTDKFKVNAGSSVGKLVAIDVVAVDTPLYSGFSLHPTERIQLALERDKRLRAIGAESDLPPFVFIVNIVLPGPPFYHGVFYYAIDDMSSIDGSDGSGSSKLCQKFFFGDSDEFRDKTFKLIPQIVEGNFLVRKAVGSTPAIMGTKLRQLYVRDPRFMELILDCGSSPVATGVIRLSLGYAKTLVIDMGFLLEGTDESTLPERIFGAIRIKNLVFGPHLRKVEQPPQVYSADSTEMDESKK